MRNIKFRGKRIDNGEWVYGFLVKLKDGVFIHIVKTNKYTKTEYTVAIEVRANSVGQFTGLTDKNGKEIYEGDIVTDGVGKYKIVYDLKLAGYQPYCIFRDNPENYCEVIGNVFENADLVKL